jgi:hypothetical protein
VLVCNKPASVCSIKNFQPVDKFQGHICNVSCADVESIKVANWAPVTVKLRSDLKHRLRGVLIKCGIKEVKFVYCK